MNVVDDRRSDTPKHWGEQHNYFDSPDDAEAFYDELVYMLIHQMAAPNSPKKQPTAKNWSLVKLSKFSIVKQKHSNIIKRSKPVMKTQSLL